MAFPTITTTSPGDAASALVSTAAAAGLNVAGLSGLAQLQIVVANLLVSLPGPVTVPATSITGVLVGANGGTGVANTSKTITLGGSLTTSGAFDTTITVSGTTSVTLPTSGTLVNTAVATLSSLTTVGALNAGSITSGFGAINIGADGLTCGAIAASGIVTVSGSDAIGLVIVSDNASTAGLSISNTATGGKEYRIRSTASDGRLSFRNATDAINVLDFAATTGAATLISSITTADPTGGAGAWKLGIANAVSPTSPNRTLTVDVGGTLYYIHAKTTNN